MVALTHRNDAYYSDYLGKPCEFIAAAKYGYLYQGQYYIWQKKPRGTPCRDLDPACFVNFIQNHDQIANSGSGERAHQLTSPGRFRAMTALLMLSPGTPMLFQGQEFAASSPFFYFADHTRELAEKVGQGRAEFLSQFRNLATPEMQARLPNPSDPETFERCKLKHEERQTHAEAFVLHRDLIRLRQQDPTFGHPRPGSVDGAVLAEEAFVLRFFGEGDQDRLLFVNFSRSLHLRPSPEPLLAPPAGQQWALLWSSEDPLYGGGGTPPLEVEGSWWLPGEAAVVLKSQARE
jgi:maltooligosyltrehalose trehalohydrolase